MVSGLGNGLVGGWGGWVGWVVAWLAVDQGSE